MDNVIAFPQASGLDAGVPELHPDDARALAPLLSPDAGSVFDITLPGAEIAGLLGRLRARAGGQTFAHVATGLMRGMSRRMACVGSGLGYRQVNEWLMRDAELADLLKQAEDIGFALVHEREMYRRAHAGAEDRGSVRMLEVIAKARDPQYREKYQVEHEHVIRAEERTARVLGAWQGQRVDDGYDDE